MDQFELKVWDESKAQGKVMLFSATTDGNFRVGRQTGGETAQIGMVTSPSDRSKFDQKLIIAFSQEREYSRHFADIRFDNGSIEVHNTSQQAIVVGEQKLHPDQRCNVQAPTRIDFFRRTLGIESLTNPQVDGLVKSIPRAAQPPRLNQYYAPTFSLPAEFSLEASAGHEAPGIDSDRLLELLQTMLQIFQDPPNSQQFFDQAAMAMIQLLQLDHVLIAFHQSHAPDLGDASVVEADRGKWCYQSMQQRHQNLEISSVAQWEPSSNIVKAMEIKKETVYQVPDAGIDSLSGAKCLVASPLLNSADELIGFIYGDREVSDASATIFTEAEAKFTELFANGISIGLERLNQEHRITQMRSRFDQFFTPELARRLEQDSELLEPRSAQVSVLFADIRGFSRISERIGPEKTISWINSVMNHLSDCVLEHDGVVVDYIGDEILAMWGAPIDRENHSELAVRAALEMQARLPQINEIWESVIGEPVEIGIGVNSGEAQVGNTGSDRKFKYGPLGDVVNVSSRVQSATKQLGTKLLVTEKTVETLPDNILSRRIRTVQFVNVQRAINVFEVPVNPTEEWSQLKVDYEAGLEFYERGELREASQKMASVINRFPDDGPAVHLLSDSVSGLTKSADEFNSVWKLSQK